MANLILAIFSLFDQSHASSSAYSKRTENVSLYAYLIEFSAEGVYNLDTNFYWVYVVNKTIKLWLSSLFVFVSLAVVSAQANAQFPNDLSDVVFIEEPAQRGVSDFVRGMPVQGTLSVSIGGSHPYAGQNVVMASSMKDIWPVGGGDLTCCNSNAWLVVNVGGTWYAGTWEFMRKGQTTKSSYAMVGPNHLRYPPLSGFQPRNGEIYGFFMAGITRPGLNRNNVYARTPVAFFQYGVGPVDPSQIGGGQPEPEPEPPVNISPVISTLLD